jgi:excisionase family DNA binding protein
MEITMSTDAMSDVQTLPPVQALQDAKFIKEYIQCALEKTLPPALTMQDVQAYLRISRPKTYDLAHTPGFPAVRIGRAIRVPREAFLRWLAQQAGVEE